MKDRAAPAEQAMREARLAGFTVSHFAISGIGFTVSLLVFALSTQSAEGFLWRHSVWFILGNALLLLLYAGAGFWCAREKRWGVFGSRKEGLWAFLDPALIAWGWGALVVLSLALNAWPLLLILFCASLFLASPSCIMVLLAMVYWPLGVPGLCLWAFLAGGVPPLLFFLGSLLGGEKKFLPETSFENGV